MSDHAPSTTSTSTLHLYSATASLESLWPNMAAQLGVPLRQCASIAEIGQPTSGVVVVVAAGEELRLPELIGQVGAVGVPIIAVGVDEGRRVAIDAVRAGAIEYFCLPQELDALRSQLRSLVDQAKAAPGRDRFADAQQARHGFAGVYGNSPALLDAVARAKRVIPFERLTLLLTGESGTGKEVFARAVHYNGPRRTMPFVGLNCAAIPLHLLESELFGHERGAFTGASQAKTGLFEVANGGTLLLDEIGHMDLTLQGKLLRVLEERVIRRVGGTKDIPVDIRVLAATHVDLGRAVSRGEFRADLFYRLNVVSIALPPLRERGNDVLILAEEFIARVAKDYGVPVPKLSEAARRRITRHTWPGNVRELRNAMERATLLAADGEIHEKDLEIEERTPESTPGRLPFPATLSTIIRAATRETVALHDGNRSEAARRLGISRSRLHRLLDTDGDLD
jgi:DNA-binding NtrC family response regulator